MNGIEPAPPEGAGLDVPADTIPRESYAEALVELTPPDRDGKRTLSFGIPMPALAAMGINTPYKVISFTIDREAAQHLLRGLAATYLHLTDTDTEVHHAG